MAALRWMRITHVQSACSGGTAVRCLGRMKSAAGEEGEGEAATPTSSVLSDAPPTPIPEGDEGQTPPVLGDAEVQMQTG